MATRPPKSEPSVVSRLAERGEEAVNRVVEELGRNPLLTDALGRAMSAKGRLDSASRSALGQVGLAAADEVRDLRAQVEALERRLAKLEASSKPTAARATGRKTAKEKPAARKPGGRTSPPVKTDAEKAASRSTSRTSGA